MQGISLNGRFPHSSAATFIGTKVANVNFLPDAVTIRLEHDIHPDFWQAIRIPMDNFSDWYFRCLLAQLTAEDGPLKEQGRVRELMLELEAILDDHASVDEGIEDDAEEVDGKGNSKAFNQDAS